MRSEILKDYILKSIGHRKTKTPPIVKVKKDQNRIDMLQR